MRAYKNAFFPVFLVTLLFILGNADSGNAVWNIQTVDSGNVGQYCSLKVDSNNNPSIAYYDAADGNLKYANLLGGTWYKTTVDSEINTDNADNVGEFASLVFDNNNQPQIAYYDRTNGDLKYAYYDSTGWHISTLYSDGDIGQYSSIGYGYFWNSYTVLITCYDATNGNLIVCGTGGCSDVDSSSNDVGRFSSFVFTGYGLGITYYDATNLDLIYYGTSNNYTETVDSSGDVGQFSSLAIDSNGFPHISYYDATNNVLKYAHHNGTSWNIETVDSTGDVGQYTSIALDKDNHPHISYYDVTNTNLKHAYHDGASWHIETIDSTGDVGRYSSLAVDNNGYLHISYYDSNNSSLKYVTDYTPSNTPSNTCRYERMFPALKQPWYFSHPYGVAIDESDFVYVLDNKYIYKLTLDGALVTKWETQTNQIIEDNGNEIINQTEVAGRRSSSGMRIAVDSHGYIYALVDGDYHFKLNKFTKNGACIQSWRCNLSNFTLGLAIDNNDFIFVVTFEGLVLKFSPDGNVETWKSNLEFPRGITFDSNDFIYITELNNGIKKFSADGTLINIIVPHDINSYGEEGIVIDEHNYIYTAQQNGVVHKYDPDGNYVASFGGPFGYAAGINMDGNGNIYVADGGHDAIEIISQDGMVVSRWASSGNEDGFFMKPSDCFVDKNGNIYVADKDNDRIQKFTPDGRFITQWGRWGKGYEDYEYFWSPYAICGDRNGFIYVVNSAYGTLVKFTNEGDYVKDLVQIYNLPMFQRLVCDIAIDSNDNIFVAVQNNTIKKYLLDGTLVKEWPVDGYLQPTIAVNSNNEIYVTVIGYDFLYYYLLKFTNDGASLSSNILGINNGGTQSMEIDKDGFLYFIDPYNDKIDKLTSNGTLLASFGEYGSAPGKFNFLEGSAVDISRLFIDNNNKFFVVDAGNNRIQIFKPATITKNTKAIIVAGGGPYPGNNLWDATQVCANFAYNTLIYQGFTKDEINYLSADTDLDLDGNGKADDVDNDTTSTHLANAVKNWASDADNLIVYLVDHGGSGTFRMSATETLLATDLADWLNQIPATTFVVYDACDSGSFQDVLAQDGRIVITSTSPGEKAKFLNQGNISFSMFFWSNIFSGMSIEEAFAGAQAAVYSTVDWQTPLVNGDVINKYIGNGVNQNLGEAPIIGNVSPSQHLTKVNNATLYADPVTDPDGVTRVWAIIWSPCATVDENGTSLPTVELLPVGNNRYEGKYTHFSSAGTYSISIYAMDRRGNVTQPKHTIVTRSSQNRALIVAGSSQVSPLWPSVEKGVKLAYESLIAQSYSPEDIYLMSPVASMPGYDCSPSSLYFASYLNSIPNDQSVGDVVIYLIGSGTPGAFSLNATETLTTEELKDLLDELQPKIAGNIVLIYDADCSGSFLPELAGPGRVLISSACANDTAYFTGNGDTTFSTFFWGHVSNGVSIGNAFNYARNAIASLSRKREIAFSCYRQQNPLLDADGDGIGNESADYDLVKNSGIGTCTAYAASAPHIGTVTVEASGSSIIIGAQDIGSEIALQRVWAKIKSLSYCPGSSQSQLQNLPEVELTPHNNGIYTGTYTPSPPSTQLPKAYKVLVYAKDEDNNTSEPYETKLYQPGGDMYEPDDQRDEANPVIVDHGALLQDGSSFGLPQPHNFHAANDEDWAKFYYIPPETQSQQSKLRIEAAYLDDDCDPSIEVFYEDSATPIDLEAVREGNPTVGYSKAIDNIQLTREGMYYVHLVNDKDGVDYQSKKPGYFLRVWHPYGPVLGEIYGTISNSSGAPINEAMISTSAGYTGTSHNGDYVLPHKQGPNWSLTAEASGYAIYRHPAPVSVVEGQKVEINIVMQPAPTTTIPRSTPGGGGGGAASSTTTTMPATGTTTAVPSTTTTVKDDNGTSSTTTTAQIPAPGTTTITTTTIPRLCPAQQVLGSDRKAELDILRTFRDQRLAKSSTGKVLITLYYAHSTEITDILSGHPDIAAQARALILEMLPSIESGLASGSESAIPITNTQHRKIINLMRSIQQQSSPALQKSISFALNKLNSVEIMQGIKIMVNK